MRGGLPSTVPEIRERLLNTSDLMLETLLGRELESERKLRLYLTAASTRITLIREEMQRREGGWAGGEAPAAPRPSCL